MAAVDLGALKNKPQETDEPVPVATAFLVVIHENGAVQASPDINALVRPEREATIDDMQMAAHKIDTDIQITKTAQVVEMSMRRAAVQAAEQANAQRITQSLKL